VLTLFEVLLEAPFDPIRRQMNSVLLTVDLTKAVVDEAIERDDSIVVAYRASGPATHKFISNTTPSVDPIIFRGLKSLTLANSQQQSLLRLAGEGISVGNTQLNLKSSI
jgi:putative NIF3 family GTP cyclohydrolase 1 type 2